MKILWTFSNECIIENWTIKRLKEDIEERNKLKIAFKLKLFLEKKKAERKFLFPQATAVYKSEENLHWTDDESSFYYFFSPIETFVVK